MSFVYNVVSYIIEKECGKEDEYADNSNQMNYED